MALDGEMQFTFAMLDPILESSQIQCFNCGKNLEKPAAFCPHCGLPFPVVSSFVIRLLRGLAGGMLVALSWTCGLISLSLLLPPNAGKPMAFEIGLVGCVFSILCYLAFRYLSQNSLD